MTSSPLFGSFSSKFLDAKKLLNRPQTPAKTRRQFTNSSKQFTNRNRAAAGGKGLSWPTAYHNYQCPYKPMMALLAYWEVKFDLIRNSKNHLAGRSFTVHWLVTFSKLQQKKKKKSIYPKRVSVVVTETILLTLGVLLWRMLLCCCINLPRLADPNRTWNQHISQQNVARDHHGHPVLARSRR